MQVIKLVSLCGIGCLLFFTTLAEVHARWVIELKLEVEWGRRSKDCRGFGVCSAMIITEIQHDRTVMLRSDRDMLSLDVPHSIAEKFQEQFEGTEFGVEEDFVFSEEISEKLRCKELIVLKQGFYRMEKFDEFYRIYLN